MPLLLNRDSVKLLFPVPHSLEQLHMLAISHRDGRSGCSRLRCRLLSTFGCRFGCRFGNCWCLQLFGDPLFLRDVPGKITITTSSNNYAILRNMTLLHFFWNQPVTVPPPWGGGMDTGGGWTRGGKVLQFIAMQTNVSPTADSGFAGTACGTWGTQGDVSGCASQPRPHATSLAYATPITTWLHWGP